MKKLALLVPVLLSVAVLGCATKQYPQSPAVTVEEAYVLTCGTLTHEIAKLHGVQSEIDATAKFDGKSVLSFLGDFGIGNVMAEGEARQKARCRLDQLETLKAAKYADKK